jgi:hypothetical protein
MNIFILDKNPVRAARYHCDKHVSKMILESAQMLSTVLDGPYKPTHQNHPCTKWIAESQANAEWVVSLAWNLNAEWRERYGHNRHHKSWNVIRDMEDKIAVLPNSKRTPFVLAMPDEFRGDDPVESYRNYYRSKSFARWDYSAKPRWW